MTTLTMMMMMTMTTMRTMTTMSTMTTLTTRTTTRTTMTTKPTRTTMTTTMTVTTTTTTATTATTTATTKTMTMTSIILSSAFTSSRAAPAEDGVGGAMPWPWPSPPLGPRKSILDDILLNRYSKSYLCICVSAHPCSVCQQKQRGIYEYKQKTPSEKKCS